MPSEVANGVGVAGSTHVGAGPDHAASPHRWWRRRAAIVVMLVAVLVVGAIVARAVALHRLAAAIDHLLGPRGTYASMDVALSGLHLRGIRIAGDRHGAPAWPVDDELRADDLQLVLDPHSWWPWEHTRHVRSITVHGGYLAVLRSADGKLHVLPSLVRPKTTDGTATPSRNQVLIDRLEIDGVALEYIDAHVRAQPHRVRLDGVHGSAGPQRLPQADLAMAFDLHGTGPGPNHGGRVDLTGQATPSTRDAELRLAVVGADLVALEPYLLKVDKGGVRAGTLDLSLHARVADHQLTAPGSLVLHGLELGGSDDGVLSRIKELPRRAVLASMTDHGRLSLKFTVSGPLSAPRFRLDEDLATRAAGGVAKGLGVTIGGLLDGLGAVVDSVVKP